VTETIIVIIHGWHFATAKSFFARTAKINGKNCGFYQFADNGSAPSHKDPKSNILSCDLGYICIL